jgi:hypothetical protein
MRAASVDWRNRWGWNWITTTRNQAGAPNCWAFAATALYEAMVRIEHCVWCRRSEGDAARGAGKQAWDFGNVGEVSIFVERYGLADPDCFPWSTFASIYSAKPHGTALSALPLSPTPDRAGRTMRISPGHLTGLSDVEQKKTWIDAVGPMAVMVDPPADFGALGSGIYTTVGPGAGMHALLVIGYDDPGGYWIVKNSWGPGWGVGGCGRVGYAANLLEPASFIGARGTNADPWTKRRQRNGNLIESGNGRWHNNFEIFLRKGLTIEHWWREHGAPGFPWNRAEVVRSTDPYRDTFHDDCLECPVAVQSTFNRNYELIYKNNVSNTLRHAYWDQASGNWYDATAFGPTNPLGMPGFVQSTSGAPGDFEVVVLNASGEMEHWTKHNSAPWRARKPGEWYLRSRFGSGIVDTGPALVQSRNGIAGELEEGQGELHFVCLGASGQMQHYVLTPGQAWTLVATFGTGAQSGPAMIEGAFAAKDELTAGNLELCIAHNAAIEHWWRNHTYKTWQRSATFGSNVRCVVGMLQGSFGFNLELVVETLDVRYQHYWRDGAGWHQGVVFGP